MDEISNKLYIKDKIHDILQDMMIDIVREKPNDSLEFMIHWIRSKRHPDKLLELEPQIMTRYESQVENKNVVYEQVPLKDKILIIPTHAENANQEAENSNSQPSSNQFYDTINMAQVQLPPPKSSLTPQHSIIQFNSQLVNAQNEEQNHILLSPQIEELIPSRQPQSAEKSELYARFIQKSKDQMNQLLKAYASCRFFACQDNQPIIIGAMQERIVKQDEYIINQGDAGDELYLIVEGSFDCMRRTPTEWVFIRNLSCGQIFGELALLYDQKRSASIQAKVNSIVYTLDKDTFVNHAKLKVLEHRDKYIKILNTIRVFNKCDPYDLVLIADNLRTMKYKRNETIIKEGDQPDYFYLVENGFVKATKLIGNIEQEVYTFSPGDYFGEIALLREGMRTATVKCKSDCLLLAIDAHTFKTFPINVLNSLRVNAERYSYCEKMEPSKDLSAHVEEVLIVNKSQQQILQSQSFKEKSKEELQSPQQFIIQSQSFKEQQKELQSPQQQILVQSQSIKAKPVETLQHQEQVIKHDSSKEQSVQQLQENNQQIHKVEVIQQNHLQEQSQPSQLFNHYQIEQVPVLKARSIVKSKEQMSRLSKKMLQCPFFSCLDKQTLEVLMGAMEEKKFKEHDFIIKQGDDGDELYLIDQGLFDCTKKSPPNHDNKWVKSYQPGQLFGELALLHDHKRAATVQGKTDSVLWCLDKETFAQSAKAIILEKRLSLTQFLNTMSIFKSIDPYELVLIADCLKQVEFQEGAEVIKQGVQGDAFYIIKSGTLKAIKLIENVETEVFEFQTADYFGEMSLLKDVSRQASIVCKTDCVLLSLEKAIFKRLPITLLNDIRKNSERYQH